MKKIKNITSAIIFLVIVGTLLSIVSYVAIPYHVLKKQVGLYENEPKNSIDVAFIGSSSTFRYYDNMAIWDEYNITSMTYNIADMPFDYTIPMIDLIQQRQSPQVYVIDLRSIVDDEYSQKYYGFYEDTNYMDSYIRALDLQRNFGAKLPWVYRNDYVEDEEYMYMFSILHNHSSFVDGVKFLLENEHFSAFKGNENMVFMQKDMTEEYVDFTTESVDDTYELTRATIDRMNELFEFAKENNLNLHFTFTPYVGSRNMYDSEIRNSICKLVEENGFSIVDYKKEFKEIDLDLELDFYDDSHTNAVGAKKYTMYFMVDLLELYPVSAEHNNDIVSNWNDEFIEWIEFSNNQNMQQL